MRSQSRCARASYKARMTCSLSTGRSYARSCSSREQDLVVELGLVGEDVGVRPRGRHQVGVADDLADSGPREALSVQERDAPVPQVVRAEQSHAGEAR